MDMWAMQTKVTNWQTSTLSVTVRGNIKKLFFHHLYLKILNSQIFLKFCGSKLSHRDLRIVRNILACLTTALPNETVGRPSALATRVGCMEESSDQHWPTTTEMRMDCVVCHGYTKKMPNSEV